MPNVLVFGNFEINFSLPDRGPDVDAFLRRKERLLNRALTELGGEVESFEFEGFGYGDEDEGAPSRCYYYNKQENNHKRV